MNAFLISTGAVALSEIGDKTQLLAFLLAAQFKKPIPIILGITCAAIINHGMAGILGAWVSSHISPESLRWLLGLSFLGIAVWVLIPDTLEKNNLKPNPRFGLFITTCIAFFLAEIGDKTQLATVALTMRFESPLWVIAGTTLGMLLADIPAVFLGDTFAKKVSLKRVRTVTASIFLIVAIATLCKLDHFF